jgi:hypothetical protein
MATAIGMTLTKKQVEPDASKFFGDPLLPDGWAEDIDENTIFLCQIRLSEIAKLDTEHVLPHTGYLYIFLDTYEGEYALRPLVRYFDGEPCVIVEGFNEMVADYEAYNEDIAITFSTVEEDAEGVKLLGSPADWNYEEEAPRLLLQIDHFDDVLHFLPQLDGFTYLCLGEDTTSFTDVYIHQEYS